MTDPSARLRRRRRSNSSRRLIHLLNSRYHEQWERAENLERQLALARQSWAGPLFAWLRHLKRWLRPTRYTGRPGSAPGELAGAECQRLTEPPIVAAGRVSVVIPFKDRLELLRGCLRSLRPSHNQNFEIVLVDNGSETSSMRRALRKLDTKDGYTILHRTGMFNFSWLCNEGAKAATGEFVLFLNNDVEALSANWLDRLLRVAALPEVGVVGATLLYPDGTLQHAGLFPRADGIWIHGYRGQPAHAPGDGGELAFVRTVPAVTAACLLVRRSLFQAVGGFDERLPLTYNDVDLCRRIRETGRLIAITPFARLLHYEALTRGFSSDELGSAHLRQVTL
jgi:O-antigen biosynthesis protein